MFNCAVCREPVGPRVKPIFVTIESRPMTYHNEYRVKDEYDNYKKVEVDSVGEEIVRELQICQNDAADHYGIPLPGIKPLIKPPFKFEETQIATFKTTIAASAAEFVLHHRINHQSKRAAADSQLVVQGLNDFVRRNPKVTF